MKTVNTFACAAVDRAHKKDFRGNGEIAFLNVPKPVGGKESVNYEC